MSSYRIELVKHDQKQGPIIRWWLDSPISDATASLDTLTGNGLVFQGWVLQAKPADFQVYVRHGDELAVFEPDCARPDVIEIILKQKPEKHPQLSCGFRFPLPLTSADFELGVIQDDQYFPLCQGHISGPFKVLEGKGNWLFLDNDTNKSVEQFTGKQLLEAEAKQSWQLYMAKLQAYAAQFQCKHALLMAPAKEAVYTEFYPYAKGALTPVEQVLRLVPVGLNLCYPVEALQQSAKRSFRVTDTHWSPFGAMVAAVELAVSLGLVRENIEALFANDEYRRVPLIGDLGNKMFPPRSADEWLLKSFSYRKSVVSDNGLANFGRTLCLANELALVPRHLVIFGASSSYSMLDYLCRIFGRITLMHTAGNIDPGVVAELTPDYLVCQTNARYVVRAPDANYSLAAIIAEKSKDVQSAKP
ncbi:alginate O-acetyltransferase AlgX-related protein [Rheinheimera soli]|uniref:AlgX/AlgJ SGNH hydrolase-like domain-containing protein n=1 Tax=Rheinheimera soli TaxID=443616 RepID=A0ABU1VUC8_9GAMM|nr:hypothetical protein [Rheinheimera soli]MDR7119321.1 hypothetical protein [Rheinheimera soli]